VSSAAKVPDPAAIGDRVRTEVERAIQRNIKGLEFLTATKQPVGAMANDLIVRRGTMALYRYRPLIDEVYRLPLLIVTPPSNKGYIFDLASGQSFVEFMLARGYDIFLLDWMPPRRDEAHLGLEDYLLDFIPFCIERVQEITGEPDLTLAGYCMGGTLAVMYAALHPDGPAANLLCFTTPIDFSHMRLFRAWATRDHFDVDRLVDTLGNIPPDLIFASFDMLRPAARLAGNIRLLDNMWNDEFVKSYRMFDRWATDALPLAGEYFRQTTKELMWKNGLMTGELAIGGRKVDLANIEVPLLHVVAEHDHIVPYEASKPLVQKVGSADKEEVVLKGGHISLVAGANAQKRLWPRLDRWLQERSL